MGVALISQASISGCGSFTLEEVKPELVEGSYLIEGQSLSAMVAQLVHSHMPKQKKRRSKHKTLLSSIQTLCNLKFSTLLW